jgi:hypothetical protein
MPKINEQMDTALVETVHLGRGSAAKLGAKLLDLSIDLSSAFSQNCPPVSYYRLVLREAACLREICVAAGDRLAPGDRIALLTSTADEAIGGTPVREARIMTAGINYHDGMWSGRIA